MIAIQRLNPIAMKKKSISQRFQGSHQSASPKTVKVVGLLSSSLAALGLMGLAGCRINTKPQNPPAATTPKPANNKAISKEKEPPYTTKILSKVAQETFQGETYWSVRADEGSPKWMRGRKYRLIGDTPEITQAINQKIEQWANEAGAGKTPTIRVYGDPGIGNGLMDYLPMYIRSSDHVVLENNGK